MCSSRVLAHWSYKHKNSLFTKHTPVSLSPYMKANSICTIHSLWMNILLAKARDTHRDHLCIYTSGVLWVQILTFKLLILPISCGIEARKECRTQHRVCCVREIEGSGEMGQLTMGNNTEHTDNWRKQEENSHSWHRKWTENGLKDEKKYHVMNTCLEATGNGREETQHQAERQRRVNLS